MYLPRFLVVVALAASAGCDRAAEPASPVADQSVQQAPSALVAGEVHPSDQEVLEDLEIMVLLGIWLDAEKHRGLFNFDRTAKAVMR
jgi:hypothetical protein